MYWISGIGMTTSLGGVVEGSAAQRAGITRPCEIDLIEVPDDPDGGAPLKGHRVRPYSEGFVQIGLWVRMIENALRELLHLETLDADGGAEMWKGASFLGAVPIMEWDRFLWPEEAIVPGLSEYFVASAASLAGIPVALNQVRVVADGHTAVAKALTLIREARVPRALVLAADSWIDPQSLAWLAQGQRLKTGEQPTGFAPGEGAVCLLIESDEACRKRGGRPIGTLYATAVVKGSGERDPIDIGRRLASAIRSALDNEKGPPFAGDVYLDLNGENWRASAWGNALVHLHGVVDFDRCRWIYPCSEMGETGAASGGIAVCLGLRSFARGYSRGERTLVCNVSDTGDVGVIFIGRSAEK